MKPLLICYDGSDAAREALESAAKLLAPRHAVVACFWQPFAESSKRLALNILELVQDATQINQREEELAQQTAGEGRLIAIENGLNAECKAIKISSPIDEAILSWAEELDAAAIVLGSRSTSSVRSFMLGNTANEVVQRATRPVLLTPSATLARRRGAGPG